MLSLKKPLTDLGFQGKLLTHKMEWFGDQHYHPMTAYKSNNPYTIGKQLDVMQAVEIDGVISTWQGPTVNPFAHDATMKTCEQLSERGMLFALLLDPWVCRGAINDAQAKLKTPLTSDQVTAIANPLVVAALNDPTTQAMLNSPAYLPEKFVLDFGTGANFATVEKSVGAMQFLMRHVGYSWPEITNTLATLAKDNANPMMAIPGLCPKFFDGGLPRAVVGTLDWNTQSWGSGASRSIEDQAGNFWHDQVALVPLKTPYAAVVTWNDYNERTAVEPFCSIFTGKRIN